MEGNACQRSQTGNEARYVCQATQLLEFTTPLPWYDLGSTWKTTLQVMLHWAEYFVDLSMSATTTAP